MGVNRNPLGRLDQQVLQRGGGVILAANAQPIAALALGGLFALITEHGKAPVSYRVKKGISLPEELSRVFSSPGVSRLGRNLSNPFDQPIIDAWQSPGVDLDQVRKRILSCH